MSQMHSDYNMHLAIGLSFFILFLAALVFLRNANSRTTLYFWALSCISKALLFAYFAILSNDISIQDSSLHLIKTTVLLLLTADVIIAMRHSAIKDLRAIVFLILLVTVSTLIIFSSGDNTPINSALTMITIGCAHLFIALRLKKSERLSATTAFLSIPFITVPPLILIYFLQISDSALNIENLIASQKNISAGAVGTLISLQLLIYSVTYTASLSTEAAKLRKIASMHDAITGALNPKGFEDVSKRIRHMCARLDQKISLVAIQVDGERTTKLPQTELTNIMQKHFVSAVNFCLRKHDQIAHIGEGKFLLLLPFTDIERAELAVNRMLRYLETEEWSNVDTHLGLSFKIGITNIPRTEMDLSTAIERATYAMSQSTDSNTTTSTA